MRGPAELYALLDTLGIPYEYHEHQTVATVEEAMKYWAGIDSGHCKNIFFRNPYDCGRRCSCSVPSQCRPSISSPLPLWQQADVHGTRRVCRVCQAKHTVLPGPSYVRLLFCTIPELKPAEKGHILTGILQVCILRI